MTTFEKKNWALQLELLFQEQKDGPLLSAFNQESQVPGGLYKWHRRKKLQCTLTAACGGKEKTEAFQQIMQNEVMNGQALLFVRHHNQSADMMTLYSHLLDCTEPLFHHRDYSKSEW